MRPNEDSSWNDKLSGGKADSKKPTDFDPVQMKKGIEHELEHTNDKHLAAEIAMDHLSEDPKYYDHLKESRLGVVLESHVTTTDPEKVKQAFKDAANRGENVKLAFPDTKSKDAFVAAAVKAGLNKWTDLHIESEEVEAKASAFVRKGLVDAVSKFLEHIKAGLGTDPRAAPSSPSFWRKESVETPTMSELYGVAPARKLKEGRGTDLGTPRLTEVFQRDGEEVSEGGKEE